MSNSILLGVGAIVFIVTVWATLAFGYAHFGHLYDRDKAKSLQKRSEREEVIQPSADASA